MFSVNFERYKEKFDNIKIFISKDHHMQTL